MTQLRFSLVLALMLVIGLAGWQSTGPATQAQEGKRLTLAEIVRGLSSRLAPLPKKNRLLTDLVRKRGVNFPLTPEIEQSLREEGASQELLDAIRDNGPRPTPTPTPIFDPGPTPTPSGDVSFTSYSFETVTLDGNGKVVKTTNGTARAYQETLPGGVTLEMTEVPGGAFIMGSPDTEALRDADEGPRHNVTVKPVFMGRYEVTQAQWEAVRKLPKVKIELPANPSGFKDNDTFPVDSATWNEAKEFCARLSQHTGRQYRLPSEAQWEYAARAQTDPKAPQTPFAFGETITPDLVNYDGNYPYANAPKGEYRQKTFSAFSGKPNAFGLYNLHGNLWEWCEDEYKASYEGAPNDGRAVGFTEQIDAAGGLRVLRGGSWLSDAGYCRSANRAGSDPAARGRNFGVRVVVAAR